MVTTSNDSADEPAEQALREYVVEFIKATQHVDRESAEYLQHGSFRTGSLDLTDEEQAIIDRMDDVITYQPKQCYYNAQLTATEIESVTYYEGYVLPSPELIPVQHAWLEFPETGHIAEVTLRDGLIDDENVTYYGKPFDDEFIVERQLDSESASPVAGYQIEWEPLSADEVDVMTHNSG